MMLKNNAAFFLTFFLIFSFCSHAQQDILKIASQLNKLNGKVVVYYPNGAKERAIYTQNTLEKAVAFYQAALKVDVPISVALFGPEEYKKFAIERTRMERPYNQFLPFVAAGPLSVMCLPAERGSALDSMVQAMVKQSKPLQSLRLPASEISDQFITLVHCN